MECKQHNLEQDFAGCYVCSKCGRIWMPVQPEEYDAFVKKTTGYDQPFSKVVDNSSKIQENY